MKDFAGKIAVITGGGTGMGRELARGLVAEGCDVAICDVSDANMQETVALCKSEAPQGIRVTSFRCDVSKPDEMDAFRDHVREAFNTAHINLLFNNAGIAGGGSFLNETREQWEKTFNVCWGGVYNGTRSFMPLLVAGTEGHIINTSSINGIWASAGPHAAHTAYSSAKFAVRGFTESLITDLRLHAPHVQASVVMPGHVGTSILLNATNTGVTSDDGGRTLLRMMGGTDVDRMSADEVDNAIRAAGETFRDNAPTTAKEAATIILDGVKAGRWRILIGADAHSLDELIRATPEDAYETEFVARWATARKR
ncbi:MAG: SDR family NAD(P)-dependent oxidoreductase [Proteobacteria bacterium]|nr:SDR family NAD(P)-dependent oxidoreductase [Pseudomonadota bacterium]